MLSLIFLIPTETNKEYPILGVNSELFKISHLQLSIFLGLGQFCQFLHQGYYLEIYVCDWFSFSVFNITITVIVYRPRNVWICSGTNLFECFLWKKLLYSLRYILSVEVHNCILWGCLIWILWKESMIEKETYYFFGSAYRAQGDFVRFIWRGKFFQHICSIAYV